MDTPTFLAPPATPPDYAETTHTVADALAELREDNRCTFPENRTDEDKFIEGAILLMMEDRYVPTGQALGYMTRRIKLLAEDAKETPEPCATT